MPRTVHPISTSYEANSPLKGGSTTTAVLCMPPKKLQYIQDVFKVYPPTYETSKKQYPPGGTLCGMSL
jgi:hypothetical protein